MANLADVHSQHQDGMDPTTALATIRMAVSPAPRAYAFTCSRGRQADGLVGARPPSGTGAAEALWLPSAPDN